MKITKFEHACVSLEKNEQTILIDPGELGQLPSDLKDIQAVIITHNHADHFSKDHILAITELAPNVVIYTTNEVAEELDNTIVPKVGQEYSAGDFKLKFFGGQHAVIHPDYPPAQNFGVLIDEQVYYPGDSFVAPDQKVKTLLVPAEAPWMKTSEAMDFIDKIKPVVVVPTHDAVLSDVGKNFTDGWLQRSTDKIGAKFHRLKSGESLDI